MGKIICEVCGTVYPDSQDSCPICGYSRDHGGFDQGEDLLGSQQGSDYQYDSAFGGTLDDFDLSEYASLAGMDYNGGNDYGQSSYRQPQDPQTSYQQPRYQEPQYRQPQYQQPRYQEPQYRQPQYQQPRYQEPQYQQPQQGKKPIFDYDAVNPRDRRSAYDSYEDVGNEVTLNDYPQDYYDNYDGGNDGDGKSHIGLIIFLILLILALLGTSCFLLFKFIIPNLNQEPVVLPETIQTEAPATVVTTDPSIPCESLALVEGGQVELTREGQFYLIHVQVQPEDTTDGLTYTSENEAVVTVDEGGKITAVGEGSTNVILSCGTQIIKLPVTVDYREETEPTGTQEAPTAAVLDNGGEEAPGDIEEEPTGTEETFDTVEDEAVEEAEPQTPEETAEGGETAATKEATEATTEETDDGLKDVELKLKKSDLMSGVKGVSFRLELDCELTPEEVEWSSSDSRVALVKNGVVTTVGNGTCKITARYGDQEVSCVIRCSF